jgi:hypothetical protein
MACTDVGLAGSAAGAAASVSAVATHAPVYFVSHGTALHTMDPENATRVALRGEADALRALVNAGAELSVFVLGVCPVLGGGGGGSWLLRLRFGEPTPATHWPFCTATAAGHFQRGWLRPPPMNLLELGGVGGVGVGEVSRIMTRRGWVFRKERGSRGTHHAVWFPSPTVLPGPGIVVLSAHTSAKAPTVISPSVGWDTVHDHPTARCVGPTPQLLSTTVTTSFHVGACLGGASSFVLGLTI